MAEALCSPKAPSNSIRPATISARRCCSGTPIEGRGFAEVESAVTLIVAAARLRALHLAAARDLLRRRQSAAAVGRAHGADFHAHRRRHRGRAAHACSWRANSTPRSAASSRIRCASSSRRCALPTTAGPSPTRVRWSTGSTASAKLPFGRPTPDGYPLTELTWASSGQMSRRFEIARSIGVGQCRTLRSGGRRERRSRRRLSAALQPSVLRGGRALSRCAHSGCAAAREFASRNGTPFCCHRRSSTMNEAPRIASHRAPLAPEPA